MAKTSRAINDDDMANAAGGAYVFEKNKIYLRDDAGDYLGDAFIFDNTPEGRENAKKVLDYINTHDFTDKHGNKITVDETAVFL